MFTGTLRLKICEACGLRPTDFQTRHTMTFGRLADQQLIDPYVSIDVDQNFIGNASEPPPLTSYETNLLPTPLDIWGDPKSCIIEDTRTVTPRNARTDLEDEIFR